MDASCMGTVGSPRRRGRNGPAGQGTDELSPRRARARTELNGCHVASESVRSFWVGPASARKVPGDVLAPTFVDTGVYCSIDSSHLTSTSVISLLVDILKALMLAIELSSVSKMCTPAKLKKNPTTITDGDGLVESAHVLKRERECGCWTGHKNSFEALHPC
jgi:hypothetical protein